MEIESLLEKCTNYVSGDNAQPFRFKIISANEFEIYHDTIVAKHRLNSTHMASFIGLGTLLELISLQALNSGYKIKIESFLQHSIPMDGVIKWTKIELLKTEQLISVDEKKLLGAISQRCVNRCQYSQEELSEVCVQWLVAEASKNPNLVFNFEHKLSPEFENTVLEIEEEAWRDLETANDVLKWIRFGKRSAELTRDGLVWESLGLSFFQKPFLRLLCKYPAIYKILAKAGATKENRNSLKKLIHHSGGFGWFSLADHKPEIAVEAGRTIFRLWLYLTDQGYSYQPMTLAVLPAFSHNFKKLPNNWPPKLLALYTKAIELFRRDTNMDSRFTPIWGFRTGKAVALPENARSLRKYLDSVTIDR